MTVQPTIHIQSARHAAAYIERVFATIGIETHKHPTHINRTGEHIYLQNVKTAKTYHIKFAREVFLSFGKIFRQHDGKVGETLDADILKDLKDDDELFFAYPTGIYRCDVKTFKEHALSRQNDSEGIKTLSVPLDILEAFL